MLHASRSGIAVVILVSLLGWVIVPAAASAQSSVADVLPTVEGLRSKLGLSDAQAAQLSPIFAQRQAELQQVQSRFQEAATSQEKDAVLRDAKQGADAFNTKVEGFLSPSQKSKWRELRKETREKVKERYEQKHE
jgi:hypothetical protein